MKSISPVFTEAEVKIEIQIAKDQPEYAAVIGLPVSMQLIDKTTGKSQIISPWGTAVRFELSDEERTAVAAGANLILTQLNFGGPITPMNIQFVAPGEKPFFGQLPSNALEPVEEASESIADATGTTQGLSLVPKPTDSPAAADEGSNQA